MLQYFFFFLTEEDRCHPNPCLHGGVCVTHASLQYECHCPSSFAGLTCEVESSSGTNVHINENINSHINTYKDLYLFFLKCFFMKINFIFSASL